MKTITLSVAATLLLSSVFLQACKDDKDESRPEFIASSADFQNFRDWAEVATNQGPDPALGTAHQGNDETTTRTIYVKNDADRGSDGRFPVGTIVVKDTRDGDGNTMEVTAMVKRGNNFNPGNNDWEWFMLNEDGTIKSALGSEMRGAQLMDGMCGACHTQAKDEDFVFSK
jgi:hypothetical protein